MLFLQVNANACAQVLETMVAFRRAGADAILTYFAKDAARWLDEGFED